MLLTLKAMTPSLSSSANRRISSSNFSLCFFPAVVQLACGRNREGTLGYVNTVLEQVNRGNGYINTWKHSKR